MAAQRGVFRLAARENHNDISHHLVAALRNDESREYRDEVHDHVVGGDVEPLEELDPLHQPGMLFQVILVDEPDRVIVIHVMTEMFIANIFESAIRSPANPVKEAAKPGICLVAAEYRVVAAFMDHVRTDGHRMPQ